jgi:protein-S-isoprenylcysteine O-methyltransferase Ste14
MNDNMDHAIVMVPPPLVFFGYLIASLILNWAVPLPIPRSLILWVIGGLAILTGILLAFSAISHMRNAHTTPDISRPTNALVTTGPYRFTRNPIYFGFFLIYLGFTLLAGTLWGILLSPFLYWTVTHAIVHMEEGYLNNKFKEEYSRYASRVRRWI